MSERGYKVGDYVIKMSGDYHFHGVVVAAFEKLNGVVRYVVENPDGVLHIFSGRDIGTSKQAAHAIEVIKKMPITKLGKED